MNSKVKRNIDNFSLNRTKYHLSSKAYLIQFTAIVALIIYIYMGAWLFKLLEEEDESRNCFETVREDSLNRRNLTTQFFNLSNSNDVNNDALIRQNISDLIRSYARKVNNYKINYFHNCNSYSIWNFENAFLYAVIDFIKNFSLIKLNLFNFKDNCSDNNWIWYLI